VTVDIDFDSSDSVRGPGPLRHVQTALFDEPLPLELGGELPYVMIAYETFGRLNDRRDNAVLICHAISGDSHVCRHDPEDDPGWWELVVGPGRAIDTQRYFVICANVLGGCRGTTGPNALDPETGRRFGADFPPITINDMVDVQRHLIDHLGIERLLAVVGGSMGGHQAISWALRYPERIAGCIPIASSTRLTSQALAFDIVGRNAIICDPNYHGGQYYDQPHRPEVGLAVARMLGHITYLSLESMRQKFDATRYRPREVATEFEKAFSVGSYLAYQGHRFVERFDANSYIVLSRAMDQFDLGETDVQLRGAFAAAQCRWLVISFTSDWLFPPFQSRQMVDALIAGNKPVSYLNVRSDCGHDAFLLPDEYAVYGHLIASFLANLRTEAAGEHDGESEVAAVGAVSAADDSAGILTHANSADRNNNHAPTSIFHAHRLDHDMLVELIPRDASVLDLGCGDGELLALLKQRGNRPVIGAEVEESYILDCVERGLDVVQCDLNRELHAFTDGQFDYVVLSQTLQSIVDTERLIEEMLRIGRRGVVSFPNFAYRPLREMLYQEGRSPKAHGIYKFEWYNTPNRRFPSIADMEQFCADLGITIHEKVCLETESGRRVTDDANLNADLAIFVVSR